MDRKTLFLEELKVMLAASSVGWKVALEAFDAIASNPNTLAMIEQRTDAPVLTAVLEYAAYVFEKGPRPFWLED